MHNRSVIFILVLSSLLSTGCVRKSGLETPVKLSIEGPSEVSCNKKNGWKAIVGEASKDNVIWHVSLTSSGPWERVGSGVQLIYWPKVFRFFLKASIETERKVKAEVIREIVADCPIFEDPPLN